MCGIAGIFRLRGDATGGQSDQAGVKAMLGRLTRRGPDGEGLLVEGQAVLGHRRLKIIDLSDAARQPMVSRCSRFTITFNGEIYNYQELRDELGLKPEDLRSTSDTEILLEAWATWGPACLPKLVGQFAFAIYDKRDACLWLARDRFGEKPLFYHHGPETFAFASSIGALMMAPGVPRQLDPSSLQEYITLRYVVAPRTIIKEVRKIPGGSYMRVDARGTQVHQWYDPHYQRGKSATTRADREELAEEFDHYLRQATRRCLVADVRTSLLLSDGIDSNAIRRMLIDLDPTAPCFTYGYHGNERSLTVPRGPGGIGNPRTVVFSFSADERLQSMRSAFGTLTEPVGDGASLATWLLLQKANAEATVFLCGHGSDEILGGYRLHQDRFRLRVLRLLSHLPQPLIGSALDRFMYGSEPVSVRRRKMQTSSVASIPASARYIIHRPLPVDDIRELYSADKQFAPAGYLDSISTLYGKCRPDAPDLDRIQEVMIHTFLSENILSFSDSVAMDASVEVRMPFLDRDFVNFVLSLPPEARVGIWPGGINTKLILRWWGKTHLDPEMVSKRKRSFDFGSLRPLMASRRDEISSYMLDAPALRQALPGLETWLSHPPEFYRGCWQSTLWSLISLGAWCQSNDVRA